MLRGRTATTGGKRRPVHSGVLKTSVDGGIFDRFSYLSFQFESCALSRCLSRRSVPIFPGAHVKMAHLLLPGLGTHRSSCRVAQLHVPNAHDLTVATERHMSGIKPAFMHVQLSGIGLFPHSHAVRLKSSRAHESIVFFACVSQYHRMISFQINAFNSSLLSWSLFLSNSKNSSGIGSAFGSSSGSW